MSTAVSVVSVWRSGGEIYVKINDGDEVLTNSAPENDTGRLWRWLVEIQGQCDELARLDARRKLRATEREIAGLEFSRRVQESCETSGESATGWDLLSLAFCVVGGAVLGAVCAFAILFFAGVI